MLSNAFEIAIHPFFPVTSQGKPDKSPENKFELVYNSLVDSWQSSKVVESENENENEAEAEIEIEEEEIQI